MKGSARLLWKGSAYLTIWPCNVTSKTVAANHSVVCCDIYNKWVHTSYNNVTRYCYRKLQKVEIPWHCKISIRQAMLFSNPTDHHLEAFALCKSITSLKLIQSNNQLLFPDDGTENVPKKISAWHLTASIKFKFPKYSKKLKTYI